MQQGAVIFRITKKGGLYTPPPVLPESAGFRRTQLPDFVSVTRAKLAYLVREESGGVRRNMAYSGGVCGFPPYFSGGFRWTSLMDSRGPQDSTGQVQRIPLDLSDGFRWTYPTDSAGQVRWIPLDKSDGFRWTSPMDSTGLSPRA